MAVLRAGLVLFLTVCLAAPAAAQIHVDVTANGLQDGSTWTDAFVELSDALTVASSGEEVWVAAGTYRPSFNATPATSFVVPDGVAVYGGFAGTETGRDQRDWEAHVTVLSGDYGGGVHALRVIHLPPGGAPTIVDGFTVTGGSATAWPGVDRGGGIYCEHDQASFKNLVIEQNVAQRDGAGVYHTSGTATFVDCVVRDNTTTGLSGQTSFSAGPAGIFSLAAVELTRVTVSGNTVRGVRAANGVMVDCDVVNNLGGGAYFTGSSTVIGSRFLDNGGKGLATQGQVLECEASRNGDSGLVVSEAQVERCVVRENQGHGISVPVGGFLISDCIVEDNVSSSQGGGIRLGGSFPGVVQNSIVRRNVAATRGGGIFASGVSNVTVRNVLLEANHAEIFGGGWHNANGSIQLLNVTIVNNTADGGGGAIAGGSLQVRNSILWGNVPRVPHFEGGPTATFTNCLAEDSGGSGGAWSAAFGTDGGANLDTDPGFVDGSGYFDLQSDSPAIDHGDGSLPDLPATDLLGNARVVGVAVDLGVYESQCAPVTRLHVSPQGNELADGASWAKALPTLSHALTKSCGAVQEIWVAEGVYPASPGGNRDATFQLADGVAIYGGFAGHETVLEERDWAQNVTVLSGEIGNPTGDDNSTHVVTAFGVGPDTVLDGFVISGGTASTGEGAGLWMIQSSPTIRNTILSGHVAFGSGAGVRAFGGAPTFINCLFLDNQSYVDAGGAMSLVGSDALVSSSTFAGNASLLPGGAVAATAAASLTLVNSILYGNTGGAAPPIALSAGATAAVSHCLVEGSGGSGPSWNPTLGVDGGGNLDQDPLFVAAESGDVTLSPGSPAIDAGDDAGPHILAVDLGGNPRVMGLRIDMGAFEAPGAVAAPLNPHQLRLVGSRPNPFNPRATIRFAVPEPGLRVELEVYDLRGRRVRRVFAGYLSGGDHERIWDGTDSAGKGVASGQYLILLKGPRGRDTQKVLLVR